MKIYKVCPTCGESEITVQSRPLIRIQYLYDVSLKSIKGATPDLVAWEDSKTEDEEDKTDSFPEEINCTNCGHLFIYDNLYDAVRYEMVTREEWEELND